jgi:hypothetical protein
MTATMFNRDYPKKKCQNGFFKGMGECGCVKRKIVWGKVKHSCNFSAKTSFKFVSSKSKIRASFCPVFHTAPFAPTFLLLEFQAF